jgi:hypothetical protein
MPGAVGRGQEFEVGRKLAGLEAGGSRMLSWQEDSGGRRLAGAGGWQRQ